jgi:hypothetical protein
LGKRRSYDAIPSWWRRDIVSVSRWQPICRATEAATGPEKKNQAWAPFPDRDRSIAGGTPILWQVATNAATSSCHDAPSKSAAEQQVVGQAVDSDYVATLKMVG